MRHAARAGGAARYRWRAGVVIEVWPEPALDFLHGHSLAQMIVEHLVAIDLAEPKVARSRMRKIQPADTRARPHRKAFRNLDAGLALDIEQFPQDAFLGMIRTRGITRRRANAAILFFDELLGGEVFRVPISPLVAHTLVQAFGEGLGEAVRQRLGHDSIVIVVFRLEAFDDLLKTMPGRDRESAKMIPQACFFRCDEIRERLRGLTFLFRNLLAQEMESRTYRLPRFIIV